MLSEGERDFRALTRYARRDGAERFARQHQQELRLGRFAAAAGLAVYDDATLTAALAATAALLAAGRVATVTAPAARGRAAPGENTEGGLGITEKPALPADTASGSGAVQVDGTLRNVPVTWPKAGPVPAPPPNPDATVTSAPAGRPLFGPGSGRKFGAPR